MAEKARLELLVKEEVTVLVGDGSGGQEVVLTRDRYRDVSKDLLEKVL